MKETVLFRPALALAALVLVTSCSAKLEKPPVEIGFRQSLVGAGNIVRIENRSDEKLWELKVTIRSDTGEATHLEAQLPAREVLEVGWKKLRGFEVPDGAEIEVRAKGYFLPATARLTQSNKSGGSQAP